MTDAYLPMIGKLDVVNKISVHGYFMQFYLTIHISLPSLWYLFWGLIIIVDWSKKQMIIHIWQSEFSSS